KAVFPGGILEAAIPLFRLYHRLCGLPHHAQGRGVPKLRIILPEIGLGLHQADGISHHPRRHLHEGASEIERIMAHALRLLLSLALEEFRHEPLAAFHDLLHALAKGDRIGHSHLWIAMTLFFGHFLRSSPSGSQTLREGRPCTWGICTPLRYSKLRCSG